MKKEILIRRLVHAAVAFAPLYFLLPDDLLVPGLRRWILLVIFFCSILLFEAYRLWKGFTFLGLRPHELNQIASFAWAAIGITLVLWLFPEDIATAALVGMALVDPLAGELRSKYGGRGSTMALSLLAYFVLAFSIIGLWGDRDIGGAAFLAFVGAGVAIPAEAFKAKYIDDDFAMAFFPAVLMSWVAEAL